MTACSLARPSIHDPERDAGYATVLVLRGFAP